MKRKTLSLFLTLSMLMPIVGAFEPISSAENISTSDRGGGSESDLLDLNLTEDADIDLLDFHQSEDADADFLNVDQAEDVDIDLNEYWEEVLAYKQSESIDADLHIDSDVVLPLEQYDAKLAEIAAKLGTTDPMVLTENEEYVNVLLQRRAVDKAGYNNLAAKMAEDSEFAETMEWFLTDTQMLRYYSYGGDPEANYYMQRNRKADSDIYMSSYYVMCKIYSKHKEDLNEANADKVALYKRMIASIALTHSVPILDWNFCNKNINKLKWKHYSDPVERYELFKKLYNFGFLAAEFAKYNVEEMRLVMSVQSDNAQLEWMHHYYRVKYLKNPDYAERVVEATPKNVGGACGIRYMTANKDPYSESGAKYWDWNYFDRWNERYGISVHDDYFDYDVDYGFNEAGEYYTPTWLVLEYGGVCAETSRLGIMVRTAFGLASRYLSQQPAHMSYLVYNYNNGSPSMGSGYDVRGIHNSDFTDSGYSHVPAGWCDLWPIVGLYDSVYIFQGVDAIYNRYDTNYEKAETLVYLGEVQTGNGNYEEALSLFEDAHKAQYFHLDALYYIAKLYAELGKTDEEFYALAMRSAEDLKRYSLSMYAYIMRMIYPNLTDTMIKAATINLIDQTVKGYSNGVAAGYTRTLLEDIKIAGFSFDTGKLTLNSNFRKTGKDFLYSFDKGQTWNTWTYNEGEAEHQLTPEEIKQITSANGIYYKFDTEFSTEYDPEDSAHTILISVNTAPVSNKSTNTPNDDEDIFVNLQEGLEYSVDSGLTWQDLTGNSHFEGDVTVWVRKKATGVLLAGPHFEVKFTTATDTPERRYLRLSGNVTTVSVPDSMSAGPAQNALDGKLNTYWEKKYTVLATSVLLNENNMVVMSDTGDYFPAWNDEFVFMINDPHYISAIGYIPKDRGVNDDDGTITGCEVYASNDQKTWILVGSTDSWAYIKGNGEAYPREQYIDFDEPVYTKYLKIKVTKAGRKTFSTKTRGYATAAEFKLYENEVCPQKDVAELHLTVDPSRTTYRIGDKIDLDSITGRVVYTDGTRSIVPASEFEYSVNVFESTDTTSVEAEYRGAKASFAVTVKPNDRIASQISAVTVTDRKYYAGDTFDKANALVQVTDGTNKWYLLPDEYEFENPVLKAGKNTITVLHKGLNYSFTVNAENAVKEIRIDTDENFKIQYDIGDAMDLSGMSVKLVYADGNEKELTESEYDLGLTGNDVPITSDIFAKTSGTKTITAYLKDKDEINGSVEVTVLSYITDGEFLFEGVPGETTCALVSFTPASSLKGRTVEIPETVRAGRYTYTVTEIENGAFSGITDMEAVSIPKSVKEISVGAFSDCINLNAIYMPDYKTFDGFVCEDGAFADVVDGYVYLGSGLTGIASPIKGYTAVDMMRAAVRLEITPPDKTEYVLGEAFDPEGMVVTAVLPNGGKVSTHAYTMRGFSSRITGTQTITVALDGSQVTQTFTVNVVFPEITIEKSPVGATYAQGAEVDPISVTAVTGEGVTLLYQWYRSETDEKNGTAIAGATRAEYIPEQEGYYYAEVKAKDGNNRESEPVYSDAAHIMFGAYAAIIDNKGYDSLREAMLNAPENSTIRICKDIEIDATIQLAGKKFTLDGQGHTLKRAQSFKKGFIVMTNSTVITLKDIIFDGGAVWTGAIDPIVNRGLTNSGVTATGPLVLAYSKSELILSNGAVMQNNYNTATAGNNSNKILDNNLTGGAFWSIDSTLTLDGGTIRDNAADLFGSAAYMRGASVLTMYKGEITGQHAPKPANRTTAICPDNTTTVNIQGGTFSNNKGGNEGGCFWFGNGTSLISGGTFENNYSSGSGGVGFVGGTGVLRITGGTFRNNTAAGNGGALCTKAVNIADAVFENNTAAGNGGAIATQSNGLVMSGNKFTDNKAKGNGGAVWASCNVETNLESFVGNTAQKGEAIYLSGSPQLKIGNIGVPQDIYIETFKKVLFTGNSNRDKTMNLFTNSAITTGTVIANVAYGFDIDLRINGYKTEYMKNEDGKLTNDRAAVITPRVIYNKNGGTIDNENLYNIYNAGETLTLPTPHKDGYTFAGWFDNAELSGEAQTEVGANETQDKTYWAKWEIAEYSVTLNTDGGELSEKLNKYTYGVGAVLPVPSKSGYNFAGWFDNAELTGSTVTEITTSDYGDKEYWAEWAENGYSVTLYTNGGELFEDLTLYTYGVGAVLPIPEREEHTFQGWFDNADLTGDAVTEIGKNEMGVKEYWAKWDINEYEVRFVNHDGRLLRDYFIDFGEVPSYSGAAPTRHEDDKYSYTFTGWSPEITAVTGEATYTAQYEAVPRSFNVMLNTNGGIVEDEEAYMTYTYGTGLVLPVADKNGYYFAGWFDNEALEGESVSVIHGDETGDKAFWAKWDYKAPTEYTVTFVNYNNIELQSVDVPIGEIPVYTGVTPTRITDPKYSYRFIGWDRELAEVSEAATYTAKFERTPRIYVVEYVDGNAVVGIPEAGEYELIFAAYSEYGLISVENVHVTSTGAYEQVIEPQTFNADGAVEIRVMLWDNLDSITRKCEAHLKLINNN